MVPSSQAGAPHAALARALPPGWSVRARVEADLPALCAVYASTRAEELQPVPWTEQQKQDFLADQFAKQHAHYLQHYPDALWLVLECGGQVAGRVYLEETRLGLRLMDIALLPQFKGQGVGTALLRALAAYADAAGRIISLHVEPNNRAVALYRRLGYTEVETRGYYLYMERALPGSPAEAEAS